MTRIDRIWRLFVCGCLLTSACWFLAFSAGCTRLPPGNSGTRSGSGGEDGDGDSLDAIRSDFSRANDLASCRGVVQKLNTYMGQHPEAALPVLDAAAVDRLVQQFQLDPGEQQEITSKAFTLLDSQYLDGCFLMRDAAQSHQADGMSLAAHAAVAFDWVVRQVRLREDDKSLPAPPQFVLRRGWGTALERAYVFIALLRQMRLTGCLVAYAGDDSQAALQWWAVGVAADKELLLFDPRLGLPLPGPGGKGIATLAQAGSQPEVLQQLTVDKTHPYDLTPEKARKSGTYLVVPLSALAPRMKHLEDNIESPPGGVPLHADVDALAGSPAFAGRKVAFWGGSEDPNAPLRLLRSFLPPHGDGGADRTEPGRRLNFDHSVIPWESLPAIVQRLPGDPGKRLQNAFGRHFVSFHMDGTSARNMVLRGRLEEATSRLVRARDDLQLRVAAVQAEPDLDQKMATWCGEAVKSYAALLRAGQQDTGGKSREYQQASKAVEELWQVPFPSMILEKASAEPLGIEIDYLLALCKHEQAERAQARLDRPGPQASSAAEAQAAREAWTTAAHWWSEYLEKHAGAPGAAVARLCRARALEKLGDRPSAALLLQDLSGGLTPLEKTARLYLRQQLKTSR